MGNDNDDAGDDLNVDVCGDEKRKRNYQNTIRLLLYDRVLYDVYHGDDQNIMV